MAYRHPHEGKQSTLMSCNDFDTHDSQVSKQETFKQQSENNMFVFISFAFESLGSKLCCDFIVNALISNNEEVSEKSQSIKKSQKVTPILYCILII